MTVVTGQLLVCIFFFLSIMWLVVWVGAAAEGLEASTMRMAKPNCSEKCGNISVPYPFGIGDPKCSMNKNFHLECKDEGDEGAGLGGYSLSSSSPKLMLSNIRIQVINIENGTAMVYLCTAYKCHNKSSGQDDDSVYTVSNLMGTPFTISARENKFTAVGCNTAAYVSDSDGKRFESGCISLCCRLVNLTQEGSCSGARCCQTQIPSGLKTLYMSLLPVNDTYKSWNFRPCSYAFLAYQSWFDFFSVNFMDPTTKDSFKSQAVLDWVIGEETCESINKSSSACGSNTNCFNSNNGHGYRC